MPLRPFRQRVSSEVICLLWSPWIAVICALAVLLVFRPDSDTSLRAELPYNSLYNSCALNSDVLLRGQVEFIVTERNMTDWDQADSVGEHPPDSGGCGPTAAVDPSSEPKNPTTGIPHPVPGAAGTPPSPRLLLRSLKNKRDYLKTQFSQLHRTVSVFTRQRFQRGSNTESSKGGDSTADKAGSGVANGSHVRPEADVGVVTSASAAPSTRGAASLSSLSTRVSEGRPLFVGRIQRLCRGGGIPDLSPQTSPSRTQTSPSKSQKSPTKGRRSPSKGQTSPSKEQTSPSKGKTSPSKGQRSPAKSEGEQREDGLRRSQNQASPAETADHHQPLGACGSPDRECSARGTEHRTCACESSSLSGGHHQAGDCSVCHGHGSSPLYVIDAPEHHQQQTCRLHSGSPVLSSVQNSCDHRTAGVCGACSPVVYVQGAGDRLACAGHSRTCVIPSAAATDHQARVGEGSSCCPEGQVSCVVVGDGEGVSDPNSKVSGLSASDACRRGTMTVRGKGCMENSSAPATAASAAVCAPHHHSNDHTHHHHNHHQHHQQHGLHHLHADTHGLTHNPHQQQQQQHAGPNGHFTQHDQHGQGPHHHTAVSSRRSTSTAASTSFSSGCSDRRLSTSEHSDLNDHSHLAKGTTEADDELPLGSEANTLGQEQNGCSDGVGLQPPVDKRLLSLRQSGWVGGSGPLLNSGWSSFNSDLSNLTSGSANSANSLEWLLQKRQVDPEQVLINLGFGGGYNSDSYNSRANMYSRIPERFLHNQEHEAPQDEDGTQEAGAAIAEGPNTSSSSSRRNPTRAASAWTRARTMSSAVLNMRVLSALQQTTPLGFFSTMGAPPSLPPGSLPGSSPCLTPPGHPRSVLHPDNQRALAKRGYYGDSLPEGLDFGDLQPIRDEDGEDEKTHKSSSAEYRRSQFHKTRSKAQRSLVESGDEATDCPPLYRHDSTMKSVDYSTATESTDSGDLYPSSAPNTPGDVFISGSDRASPSSGPFDRLANIEDLYLPDNKDASSNGNSLTQRRQKMTEKLMSDLDNDDNYLVSPPTTRQSTVTKENSLDHGDGDDALRGDGEYRGGVGCGGSGAFSRDSRTDSGYVPNDDNLHACRSGSMSFDRNTKNVTIVVSGGDSRTHTSLQQRSLTIGGTSSEKKTGLVGLGGMNFLSIVNAAVADRLSDSGSDHTLVDQHSSSSGSPRPLAGSESPRFVKDDSSGAGSFSSKPPGETEQEHTVSQPSGETNSSGIGDDGEQLVSSKNEPNSSRVLQEGPVLYVYHKTTELRSPQNNQRSLLDENDNIPNSLANTQSGNLHQQHNVNQQNVDEDLPRMSSIQSDSSGFGDTDIAGDNGASEMASLKVSSLGSSCESSATQASTSTLLGNNLFNTSFTNTTETASTQTPLHLPLRDSDDDEHHPTQMSRSLDDLLGSDSPSLTAATTTTTITGPNRRFITTCYIPDLNRPRTGEGSVVWGPARSLPVGRNPPSNVVSTSPAFSFTSSSSGGGGGGSHGRNGVLPGNRSHGSALRGSEEEEGYRRDPHRVRERYKKNHTPLSEELALASASSAAPGILTRTAGETFTSTPRSPSQYTYPTAVPKLALRKPTLETSSVDESRASADELEHDDVIPHQDLQQHRNRSLAYSSWRSELPGSRVGGGGRGGSTRYFSSSALETEEAGDGVSMGTGPSAEGSSVYSCPSTSDSIFSGSSSELLDCQKLIRLINQPTNFKGRRAHLVRYRPKRHLRDWPVLLKKKKLQEETRLAQYAMQKYKTELGIMENAVMDKYHMAYEDMTQEDRDDVEELQHLWAEVRRQVMETEQLLTSRMKGVATGNDNFSTLTSISVMQRLIELLKEQMFQKQVAVAEEDIWEDEEQEDEEDEWAERQRRRRYHSRSFGAPRGFSSSWSELPRSPPLRTRGHYSSSFSQSQSPFSPSFDSSFEQMRSSLMSEIRQEMRSSLQTLQEDLHKRDKEIHHLQQVMLEKRNEKPAKSTPSWSRTFPRRRHEAKETDV